jgi:hypothetical protein
MSGVERTQRLLAMAREDQASPAARARMRAAIGAALALPAAIGTPGDGSASSAAAATAPATAAPIAPTTAAATATATATTPAAGATGMAATSTVGAFVAGAASGVVATMLLVLSTGLGAAPGVPARAGAGVQVAVASLSAVLAAQPVSTGVNEDPATASVGSPPTIAPDEPLPAVGQATTAGPPARGRALADKVPAASATEVTAVVPATPPSLAEETAALRKAQRALSDGDPRAAMEVLQDLSWRHPNGVLREERMVAEVAALCASGKRDAARAVADRLLAEQPSAVGAARVRASCAFDPSEK